MESAIEVSIIIINYNTFQLTKDCINSVIEFTKETTYEIILVENGTNQFNLEYTGEWGNRVKLIISDTNLGFAVGNILGIKHAKGEYILLLNSDTYLREDAISKTVNFIKSNKDIGVVSARLIYPNGKAQSVAQRFPSVKYKLIELLRIQKLMSNRQAGRTLLGSFFAHDETVAVDWVWGAFFMFPKSIISKLPLGKLDDSYFMYWEDVQWCWDVKKMGYQVWFYAGAQVVHIHEGSKGQKNEMMEKNGKLFLTKNFNKTTIFFINKIQKWLN